MISYLDLGSVAIAQVRGIMMDERMEQGLTQASNALLAYIRKQQDEKENAEVKPLFEDDGFVLLEIWLKQLPEKKKVSPIAM